LIYTPVLEIVVRMDDDCFASPFQISIWTMNLDSTVQVGVNLRIIIIIELYKNMKSIDYNVSKIMEDMQSNQLG
jgi:hypothetical protein